MTTVRASVTPHFRLDAAGSWRMSGQSSDVVADPLTNQLRLGKPGDFPIPVNDSFGTFGGMTLPRGVSISAQGRVLLADPQNNRILYFDNGECAEDTDESLPVPFRLLWKARPEIQTDDSALQHELFARPAEAGVYQLNQPRDVIFSPNGEIVIADTGNQRVLIFSWPELRLRKSLKLAGWAPWALAFDSRRRLYIADRDNGRIWRTNRLWDIDHQWDGGKEVLTNPVALTLDSEDNVLVLQHSPNTVYLGKEHNTGLSDWSLMDSQNSETFNREFSVPPLQSIDGQLHYPQRENPGCGTLVLKDVVADKSGYLQGSALPLLARPRIVRLPRLGVYISDLFDSEESGSQWHRLVLDCEIPATGRILMQTFSSDRAIYDSELSELDWSDAMLVSTDTNSRLPEMLIQSEAGRYLRVRLELLGDGFTTPKLNNILLFGPRSSSLQHLPAPFKQDPESAYFLDRMLSYFDTVQDEIRFVMKDFSRYLDPDGVPAGDFLNWLGSWFDWQFLAQWPGELRREMIRRSIEFFKLRGTLEGIRMMLQWHTGLNGDQPQIIEHFRVRDYASLQQRREVCGVPATVVPLMVAEKPLQPPQSCIDHWFSVVLPNSVLPDQESIELIKQIIDAQKPAHTSYQIYVFHQGIRIGKQSSIGVDMWLGHYPGEVLGGMRLGQSSGLAAESSAGLKIGNQILN